MCLETTSKKTRKMKKQVSVFFMVLGLLFVTCLIVANIISQKLISIGGLIVPVAIIIFPISYIVNDIIAEVWGYKKARLIIWYGFLMNFLTIIIFKLSIIIPTSEYFTNQNAYSIILGNSTFRMTVASFFAFISGSFLNAWVMSRMKIYQKGKNFSLRAVVSTFVGEGSDSFIFLTIAFLGDIPFNVLLGMILTQTIIKTGYEILVLPITSIVVKRIKKHEQENVFDENISYNPFKIKDI